MSNLDLDLQTFDDTIVESVKSCLQYPCVLISNVTKNEIEVLKRIKSDENSLPLYTLLGKEIEECGRLNIDLASFLSLRFLDSKMKVELMFDEKNVRELSLTSSNSFLSLMGMKED